jgi:hypothetical protein
MTKNRNTFLKVQREMEKKRKAEDKRKRRQKQKEQAETPRTSDPVIVDSSATKE